MTLSFEEYKKRRLAGFTPEQASRDTSPESEGFSLGRTLSNVIPSTARLVGGIADAVVHPVRTVKAIGSVAAGGVEKLIPGKQAEEASFDALTSFYKERYGSMDQFLKTLEEDPAGVLADASAVFGGAGAAIRGAGAVSKVDALTRAGTVATDVAKMVNPLSIAGNGLSKASTTAFPWLSKTIEKSNLRLTGAQTRELGNKVNEITEFLASKKLIGTPQQRYDKATAMYEAAEQSLDTFFGQMAKGTGIKKDSVIRGLQTLKGQYKNDRDSATAVKQIDGAIDAIRKNQGDRIPYANLNQFKRTTYQNAYNKAGDKVLDDVEHGIGDVVRNQLEEGLKGLKIDGMPIEEFNRQYGLLIQGRKLIKASVGKAELSPITERLLAALIGGGVAGPAGAGAGLAFGKAAFEALPITAARSAVGAGLNLAGSTPKTYKGKLLSGVLRQAPVPLTLTDRLDQGVK